MRALKIYVAGPYTAEAANLRLENVNRAIEVSVELLKRGHFPFIPHLTHYVDEWAREEAHSLEWEDYIAWDVVWLRDCDALYYIGPSRGADLELKIARHLNKRVFFSMDQVPIGDGRTTVHSEVEHLLVDIVGNGSKGRVQVSQQEE